jgi:hypothetical protein
MTGIVPWNAPKVREIASAGYHLNRGKCMPLLTATAKASAARPAAVSSRTMNDMGSAFGVRWTVPKRGDVGLLRHGVVPKVSLTRITREARRALSRQYVDVLRTLAGHQELLPFVASSVSHARGAG